MILFRVVQRTAPIPFQSTIQKKGTPMEWVNLLLQILELLVRFLATK